VGLADMPPACAKRLRPTACAKRLRPTVRGREASAPDSLGGCQQCQQWLSVVAQALRVWHPVRGTGTLPGGQVMPAVPLQDGDPDTD
jgi:hypothetical protein